MGTYYWLINQQEKAMKWWRRSIQQGSQMKARVELARTYFEVGKRLGERNGKYRDLNGISVEENLKMARQMFVEMDLQRDLDELERIEAYNKV
jgi:hypothetical protein